MRDVLKDIENIGPEAWMHWTGYAGNQFQHVIITTVPSKGW